MAETSVQNFAGKKLRNLPNFREVFVKNDCQNDSGPSGLLYRSSRPDFLTDTEVCELKRLGIRCVLDFRSPKEYARADGNKLLDKDCSLYAVKIPHRKKYKPQESVRVKLIGTTDQNGKKSSKNSVSRNSVGGESETGSQMKLKTDTVTDECNHSQVSPESSAEVAAKFQATEQGKSHSENNTAALISEQKLEENDEVEKSLPPGPIKHVFIDFFTGGFIWTVFRRAPWYIRMYALVWLFVDIVLRTGYLYFVQTFAKYVLNPNGLVAQYKDIVDLSQRSICAALKLLSDSDNVPALINCAHGKDRTGIITALVMYCLGKSDEEIAREYSKSEAGLKPVKERIHREIVGRYHFSEQFTTAEPATMLRLLEYITEKYGSVGNYLEYIGFSTTEQDQLRRNFLCTDL